MLVLKIYAEGVRLARKEILELQGVCAGGHAPEPDAVVALGLVRVG